MTRIIFVRHAQSAPSASLAEALWPLSDQGRVQALALANVLADLRVDALASSPFVRAVDTLRPYAETTALEIQLDPELRERSLGGWLPDLSAVHDADRRMHADSSFALIGGESAYACLTRFEAAIARAAAANPGARLAIGSHGGVLGHLLARHCPGLPVEFWRSIRNPHLFAFDYDGDLRWIGERTLDGSAGVTGHRLC